ncbi:MAG: hypothetical protein JNL82_37100 [Myxococcales bacterium]|nr:hypothetical protein [Myxococcales bacterium]
MPFTLEDLPFDEQAAWPLLGLDPERRDPLPDRDHEGFGWCRLDSLLLETTAEARVTRVERPLLLALHTREHPERLGDDLELEFILHDADGPFHAVARLSEFMRRRLPPLLEKLNPRPGAVVLALCNPHATALPRPAALGDLPLYYGRGDVTAFMQRRPGARQWTPATVDIILSADSWTCT